MSKINLGNKFSTSPNLSQWKIIFKLWKQYRGEKWYSKDSSETLKAFVDLDDFVSSLNDRKIQKEVINVVLTQCTKLYGRARVELKGLIFGGNPL